MNNERQIVLGFRMVDDGSGRFDRPEYYSWFTNEVGRPGGPWICPSAAAKGPDGAWWGTVGAVNSAWTANRWPAHGGEPRPEYRVGSYGVNLQIVPRAWAPDRDNSPWPVFLNEAQVTRPHLTPVVADAVFFEITVPRATDPAPVDLVTGKSDFVGINLVCIPRHGRRPNPVPRQWPASQPLPGAINVGLYDGHVELVKLDNLWQLYWHKDYQPPANRPGLQ